MKKYLFFLTISLLTILVTQCGRNKPGTNGDNEKISDDSLLTVIQYQTFRYFWDGAEPNSGLARERFHMDDIYPQQDKHVVTSGGGGFGLMAILTGIERGFITREEGVDRLIKIARFLEDADRFHGAWSHWINGETGEAVPFSKNDDGGDIVETSFMAQGMVTVYEYFKNGNEREQALANKMNELWKGVEWNWYQNGQPALLWHWSPNYGFEKNHKITGYNECLITYVMGSSSPDYPITPEAYHEGWARGGDIRSDGVSYGMPLELEHRGKTNGGPLFWAHYSYLGLNPKNLKDRYADYWRHNRNHVLINREYCIDNPNEFVGYGDSCWGLTSSYSIRGYNTLKQKGEPIPDFGGEDNHLMGYAGHSPDRDFSVISPTAALSSMPYAPEEVLKVARYFYEDLGDKLMGPYGFYDAFSLEHNWFPKKYLAIDQGPIVVMIENYRSGLFWNLFMNNEDVQRGLNRLGFTYE
ncbi:MAG: glucoamylase family protein [Bacteroidales bacterium]